MSHSIRDSYEAETTPACAIDYLDSQGIELTAYICGRCSLLASRGSDGITYTDESECENLLFDSVDREYSVPGDNIDT